MPDKFPINLNSGITFILSIMSALPGVAVAESSTRNGATARLFGHSMERIEGTEAQHDFEPDDMTIKRALVAETQKSQSSGGKFQMEVSSGFISFTIEDQLSTR